jgi:histidyl-tRNA synthetase
MENVQRNFVKPQVLKGFCDFLPNDMLFRNRVVDAIRSVYEQHGFLPIDTPALEYLATLLGSGSDETDGQIFRLESPEGEPIGLRFDLTVPFARILAQYKDEIRLPFRRYHIGSVFRADKPKQNRFRQFTQFDIDIAGTESVLADAEIVSTMCGVFRKFGLRRKEDNDVRDYQIVINSRRLMDALLYACGVQDDERKKEILRILDKRIKIGSDNVEKELGDGRVDQSGAVIKGAGLDANAIAKVSEFCSISEPTREQMVKRYEMALPQNDLTRCALAEMRTLSDALDAFGISESEAPFLPSLARGLDYYTGPVYEGILFTPSSDVTDAEDKNPSVIGGGRYDNLVSRFTDRPIPATGASIGLDRLINSLRKMTVPFLSDMTTKAIVIAMNGVDETERIRITRALRDNGIATEMYIGQPNATMSEQMSYANERGIGIAVILGPDEVRDRTVSLKNLTAGKIEREGIADKAEYRKQGKTGQATVPQGQMISAIEKMIHEG